MTSKRLSRIGAALTAGALALAGAAQAQTSGADWNAQLTLYGWGAGIGGDLTPFAGAPTLSFDKSFTEVLEDLDAAFFVTGYARRDRTVFLGDFSYSSSSKEGLVPPGAPASGEFTQSSLTLAAGRRMVDEAGRAIDLMAGARAWRIEGSVSVPLAGVSVSPEKSFVDPILAVRGNFRVSPRWSVIGYADLGGFGVGSDLTWQVVATANYKATENLYLSAGYRHLYLDYDDGGTEFEGSMSGPLLGVTWRF
ncbi:hypothetical protein HMH01_17465 [Halovulum dunhuangense]|uniref:Outer membrane protein beta-barrel domain-containing protein n=1 Tax=Halovulum dunhuangense TaxID=1505036 RepID=A0A849L6R9_9RHOB|nr:hypothetical protein [Halovulum dunhuangense]NNU82228.1 hypothetical protein [Halovulum dunhuangense]